MNRVAIMMLLAVIYAGMPAETVTAEGPKSIANVVLGSDISEVKPNTLMK